mmetsp:Transcript_45187/g.117092  ORF Transcript_45187/g.117092 Transcript_45187/m.117092 type:complete len:206 (-) Transcript_45187:326-943(-)
MPKALHAAAKSRLCGSSKNGSIKSLCFAMGKKEKIPPPPLLMTTIVSGGACGPASCWSELMSCSEATSPMIRVDASLLPRQKPAAVLITPSIPDAPRLAAGGSGGTKELWCGFEKKSRSRMGIELEIWSRAAGRISRETVCTTQGSVKMSGCGLGSNTESIASPAASESLFQKAGGPAAGSRPCAANMLASADKEHGNWCVTTWS